MSDLDMLLFDLVREFPGLIDDESDVSGADLVDWLTYHIGRLPKGDRNRLLAAARGRKE